MYIYKDGDEFQDSVLIYWQTDSHFMFLLRLNVELHSSLQHSYFVPLTDSMNAKVTSVAKVLVATSYTKSVTVRLCTCVKHTFCVHV